MSDSLKADVLKAVKSDAPAKNVAPAELKKPQVLLHCLNNSFKSPQKLNENADTDVVKKND